MTKRLKLWILLMALAGATFAQEDNYQIIIESGTSGTISSLNSAATKAKIYKQPIGQVVQWTALQLIGKPYVRALLDQKTPEYLYVSLNDTDCMLFVEEVLGASELIKAKRLDAIALTDQTKKLRYHGPVSYCMRNHYFKDWALMNISKGYVKDQAYALTKTNFPFQANVMSIRLEASESDIHKDDAACIKSREDEINQQQLGFIPLQDLPKYLRSIKSGDIIGIVRTPHGGADAVHHLGIAYVHNGTVSMIHASSKVNEVVIADTLTGYLAQYKDSQGIILLRPKEITQSLTTY